ncbi:MAG: 2-octaprenyl-6-methoxyphenyl hydroxylase [Gammaproteobacteria bacterium]|nr:2-octaprenyl-6-methoxyphenyl hydroxylase [Gammaproteobacteria bacterium]
MSHNPGASEFDYDVVIAGGGMVGASLACALAGLPLRVAVVEPVPFDSDTQPSFDLRTTALSRSSQRILDSLGLWSRVAADATPIHRIHVSEQGRFGTALIDAADQGVAALGYVLENRCLGAALWSFLQEADSVTLLCPATTESASASDDGVTLDVVDGDRRRQLRTRLLAVADGARSRLRDALGIRATTESYRQAAIVGTVEVSAPADGDTAYERFTSQGPLALLPAGDSRYVFVLTRHDAETASVQALGDDEFRELLQQSFGFRLGRFGQLGQRVAYPLALTRAARVTAPRCVIVGNAAHGLHPVAGQGYNLGLRDVATLAEVLADDIATGNGDAGDPANLERYREWRRRDQRNVVAFTDGLVRLFDLPAAGLGSLRGLGLTAFDLTPGAKPALARHAMGLGGRLTRLVRGLQL